jgi:hypothetical protein
MSSVRLGQPGIRSELFLYRLNSYALAAGAAGVSLLALTEASQARIVYKQVHKVINNGQNYRLDFNLKGVTDLAIRNIATQYCTHTDGSCWPIESLGVTPSKANEVVYNIYGAVAMKPGMKIGSGVTFTNSLQRMVWSFGSGATGSWINVKNRYLGVKFHINGKTHYGWARLNVRVRPNFNITATLTGYAYETVPDKSITAGKTEGAEQPVTLGKLALGRK